MVDLDFEDKFRKVIAKIAESGEEYAEAKAKSWYAQELKHSILASIIKGLGDLPVSKAELLAKDSEDYRNYIKETSEAIKRELSLRAEYEKWKSSFEALRSLSSLEKSTRNLENH